MKKLNGAKKYFAVLIFLLCFTNLKTVYADDVYETREKIKIIIPKVVNVVKEAETVEKTIENIIETEAVVNASAKKLTGAYLIDWKFTTYNEPSFTAQIGETFNPQTVSIIETNGDWALINTYKGAQWVCLNKNMKYINKICDIYDDKNGEIIIGTLNPREVEIIAQDGDWLCVVTDFGNKWINPALPRKNVTLDVPSYNQQELGYPTGCEIISVGMMLNYENEVDVHALVEEMPRSSNPFLGFWGDPKSKSGFSVFPTALTGLVEKYAGSSDNMSGGTVDDLKNKLNKNIPVVVWVKGLGFNVHALCLSGYNETGFFYNDPWTGQKNAYLTYDNFYAMWNKVIYAGYPNTAKMALSYFEN